MSELAFFERRSAPRFVLSFLGLLALFYFAYISVWESSVLDTYLRWNAWASWLLLTPFYDDLTLSGTVISGGFAVQVDRGCDAYLPISTFLAAVLAFPATWREKLWGLGLGLCVLLLVNLVRIASLYSIGRHAHEYFDVAHGTVWQAGFVLIAGMLWTGWARHVTRPEAS